MRYAQKLICLLLLVLSASFGVGGCYLLYSDFAVQLARTNEANAAAHAQTCTLLQTEIIDLQAERYGSNERNPYRYNVTTVITVTSSKVDLVRGLISEQGELLRKGIAVTGGDYRYNVQYEYTGLNQIKPQMIEEATKNARQAAEKFAKDSDSKLGKIRHANQGQFSISDRDANTPYIKKVRVVTTIDYSLED